MARTDFWGVFVGVGLVCMRIGRPSAIYPVSSWYMTVYIASQRVRLYCNRTNETNGLVTLWKQYEFRPHFSTIRLMCNYFFKRALANWTHSSDDPRPPTLLQPDPQSGIGYAPTPDPGPVPIGTTTLLLFHFPIYIYCFPADKQEIFAFVVSYQIILCH